MTDDINDVRHTSTYAKAERAIRKDERSHCSPVTSGLPFQKRVVNWLMECFSMDICRDGIERNHRFLEEALELVQSLQCTRSEAHQLVDYVFDRPVGEPMQELGGSLVTLTALANCHDMDLMEAGEIELARVWTKIDKIRAKQAAKPKHSPLPQHVDEAATRQEPVAWIGWHPEKGYAPQTCGHDQQHTASLLMRTGIAGEHGWSVQPLYADVAQALPEQQRIDDAKRITLAVLNTMGNGGDNLAIYEAVWGSLLPSTERQIPDQVLRETAQNAKDAATRVIEDARVNPDAKRTPMRSPRFPDANSPEPPENAQ